MSDQNKLLARYHQKLRNPGKVNEVPSEVKTPEPEKKANINPFAKQSVMQEQAMDGPVLPKVQSNQTPSYSFESMKVFNSSNEFIRLTTETFPTLAVYPSINFPIACFFKPLGSAVQ